MVRQILGLRKATSDGLEILAITRAQRRPRAQEQEQEERRRSTDEA